MSCWASDIAWFVITERRHQLGYDGATIRVYGGILCAGEIAVKLKPEELAPFATGIVERLVPILQNMNSMPRSIVENRCT